MVVKPNMVAKKVQGQAYKDKSKPADIRLSNINAAKGGCKMMNKGASRFGKGALCLCKW